MKSISQVTIAVAVVAGLTLGAAATGVAQGKSPAPRARNTSVAHPSTPSNSAPKNKSESFPRGVATKLGTTPEAMETAYATAKQADPKLTRGHFIAANMIANNLGTKNPAVTTQALLSGLQSGKSIGQTLESLGVSSKDAHDAQRQAAREAREARDAGANDH
jgi:hypothetical protein